ncbi:LOW QUALITY PROTEIN: uncharacterized protein LOC144656372 [Oculina patagonica]
MVFLKHKDKWIERTTLSTSSVRQAQPIPSATDNNSPDPVRVVLPFKDQSSADSLRTQLKDLGQKINNTIQPVFISHKIEREIKIHEVKPLVVNQQSCVYHFKCDLCDAGYVGFTRWHLHQRVDEHKNASSSIGKHYREEHSLAPKDLTMNFLILKKCKNKFDCPIFEMFFIHKLRPTMSLNVQSDSICAKVFK